MERWTRDIKPSTNPATQDQFPAPASAKYYKVFPPQPVTTGATQGPKVIKLCSISDSSMLIG